MIRVKIPATTANMGPGFDCFGMALTLYNTFEIKKDDNRLCYLENGEPSLIPPDENLILNTYKRVLSMYNHPIQGICINLTQYDIPMSRGLGSSATCILAGIIAANYILNNILTIEEIINIGSLIEGHPDNIVPAAIGGLSISYIDNKDVIYSKLLPPIGISYIVMIPNFSVSTNKAREVLPDNYSRNTCVFNIARASMLISLLLKNDITKLRSCLDDKIHQPYRKELIPDIDKIFSKCMELGSLGEFISGSGSTLISIIKDDAKIINELNTYLKGLSGEWKSLILKSDLEGIKITNV